MADIVRKQGSGVPLDMQSRYRDMDDGTHALVMAAEVANTVAVAGYTGMLDEAGLPYGVKQVDGKLRVSSMPYLFDIAEGHVPGHTSWFNFGYTPALGTAESDLWGASGVYVFPAVAQQMEAVSSDNTQDIGVVIKGDAVGNTVQADADGTTTTLEDDDVDFTAATAVAAGDIIILDPHGASAEFGTVTAVAAHTLTVAGGFAQGGSGASRYYAVIDQSAYSGALAVGIQYLDATYTQRCEIVVLNGTTPVNTVAATLFRINAVRVIAAGSGNQPLGNLSVRDTAGTVTYGYITLGYNVARSSIYTVPEGLTLYITQMTLGFGYAANQTHYARLSVHSNSDPVTKFNMGGIFYPQAEVISANTSTVVSLVGPLVFPEHTDIRAGGFASTAVGIATVAMRGWLEVM